MQAHVPRSTTLIGNSDEQWGRWMGIVWLNTTPSKESIVRNPLFIWSRTRESGWRKKNKRSRRPESHLRSAAKSGLKRKFHEWGRRVNSGPTLFTRRTTIISIRAFPCTLRCYSSFSPALALPSLSGTRLRIAESTWCYAKNRSLFLPARPGNVALVNAQFLWVL